MSEFLPDFWLYGAVLLLAEIVLYFVGRTLVCLVGGRAVNFGVSRQYASLFVGLVSVITIYAAVITRFHTIFFVVFWVGIVYLIVNRKTIKPHFPRLTRQELSTLSIFLLIGLGFFASSYGLFFLHFDGDIYYDYPFYSAVSVHLSQSGVETIAFHANTAAAMPYHYAELWFNSCIATVFGLNHLFALMLIAYPLLFAVLFVGVFALSVERVGNKWLAGLLVLIFLLMQPFVFGYGNALSSPKLTVIYILFVTALLALINKKSLLAFGVLCLSVAFFTPVAPGVYAGLFLAVLAALFFSRNKKLYGLLAFQVTLALSVLAFYFFQPRADSAGGELAVLYTNPIPLFFKWTGSWIIKFLIAGGLFLLVLAMLFRIFANDWKSVFSLCGINSDKRLSVIVFSIGGVFFSAVFGALLRLVVRDGGQVFTVFAGVFLNVLLFVALLFVVCSVAKRWLITAVAGVGLVLYSFFFTTSVYVAGMKEMDRKVDDLFLIEVKALFGKHQVKNMGYIRNSATAGIFRDSFAPPLQKLSNIMNGDYCPYWLSVFDLPMDSVYGEAFDDERKFSPLYAFITQRGIAFNQREKLEAGIIEFMKQENINSVAVDNSASESEYNYLKPYVIDEAEQNGNRVLIIDFSHN